MSDLKIGKIITETQERDAIHIAVAPMIAATPLKPGQAVGIASGGFARADEVPVGIVDPFLRGTVKPGQKFWLFMYPNTITSLRHEWTHPSFTIAALCGEDNSSGVWLQKHANEIGVTYDTLMTGAKQFLQNGDYTCLNQDTPDCVYDDAEEFWDNYEKVTGESISNKSATFFSCAC